MGLKPRLLARPRRHETESRASYLIRLAQDNHLCGLPELAKVVGLPPSDLVAMTDEAIGQYLRGIDMSMLAPPVQLPVSALELVRRRIWSRGRICPLCIHQGKHSKVYFDYPLSLRCEEHQVFLVDRCPSCSTEISYLRKHSFHCNCGQALGNLPTEKVDCAVDLFESQFSPWRSTSNWFVNDPQVLVQEIAVARAFRALIACIAGYQEVTPPSRPWLGLEDWPLIKAVMSPWPNALADSIIAVDALGDPERLASLLMNLERSGLPVFISLKDKLDRLIRAEHRKVTLDGIPMVPLKQVRDIAKLDAAATIELFKSDYFKVKEKIERPGRASYWVSKAEVEHLAKWFDETVDLVRAAEIIGCTPTIIRGLARIKRLEASYLITKPRSPRFRRSDIDKLIKATELRTSEVPTDSEPLVPLSSVVPASPGCKRWCPNWPSLIERVFAGVVPIFRLSSERGWNKLGVSEAVLRASNIKFY